MEKFLKNKNLEELKPIYLIESRSEKIIDKKIKEIKNYFRTKIDAVSDFKSIDENDDVIVNDLFNFLSIPSFFSLRKVLTVKNADKVSRDILSFLSDYIKTNPGFGKNSIIFLCCSNSRKIISMIPEAGARGELIKIDKAISEDLKKRLAEKNDLNKVRFTPNAVNLFLENIGEDPILFENEYEKILSNVYFDDKRIVNEEKIKSLVSRSTESTIFELIDNIGGKHFPGAVNMIPDLIQGSSSADNSLLITVISNLYRMFKVMLYLKSEKDGTDSAAKYLQKNINAKPYFINIIISKYQGFEKKYSYDELIRVLDCLNEFDIKIKSKSSFSAKVYLNSLILNLQLITDKK